jgi:uncharacterized protein (TIGR03437 family)
MLTKSLSFLLSILLVIAGIHVSTAGSKKGNVGRQATGIGADETTLDDFEGPNAPAPWVFSNGPEFPGASGNLTLGAGFTGRGALLRYDFTRGGAYVSAYLNLNRTLPASAIAFQIKSPAEIRIRLRVIDETGQTLQYNLLRPLTATDAAGWYRHVVKLDGPSERWGGANDGIVHGGIRAVGILAGDALEAGSAGEILFDNVATISGTLSVSLDPASPSSPAIAGNSDLLSRLGVNIHFTDNNPALDAARSAGFAFVRMDLFWHLVEGSRGVYEFSGHDRLVNALAARGMKALLILDYGNPLYVSDCRPASSSVPSHHCPPITEDAVQAFARFAEATARHFAGRGVIYEIWNEPNHQHFWPPAPNPAQYAALARAAIAGLRRGDPAAKVSTGGLSPSPNRRSSFDFAFARAFFNAGGAPEADAFSVHPYSHPEPPELVNDNMLLLRLRLGQWFSASKPVWDTEWGYSSSLFGDGQSQAARSRQAVMVARRLLSSWAMGFPVIVYYDLYDGGTDPNDSTDTFGLLTRTLTEKTAMTAVRTLTGIGRNRNLTGLLNTGLSGLYGLKFTGAGDAVLALWYASPGGSVDVRLPGAIRAVNHLGQSVAFQAINGELSLTLREADGPVYVAFGGAVANASAASFNTDALANESIAAAFGLRLATATQAAITLPLPTALAGTTVKLRDSAGTERFAPLFFVSSGQVNYQIPPGTATGKATVTITSGDGSVSSGTIQINAVAPGIFAANSNGQGVAAGYALRVKADGSQITEPIAQFDTTLSPPRYVTAPLDLGPPTDRVFLVLFGTGTRFRSSLSTVAATIGGVSAEVLYAGPQGDFVGLDQVNLLAPRSLIGRGEVDVNLMVDGRPANAVRVNIK